jgi:NADH-quinone oxidoreductase subunit C
MATSTDAAKAPAKTTPAAPAAAPAAPAPADAAAVPKPAAPVAPPAKPTGDHALLAAEFPGTSFAILEDGAGVTTVQGDDLFAAASRVRGMGYSILSLLSAYDRVDHFGVLYAFVKLAATPAEFGELRLRVVCPKAAGEPKVPSLVDLTAAADWHEREMYDMYGIQFVGHPDLRRIFLPEGWTGYPQRKDYKEPEQYVSLRDGEDTVTKHAEEGAW